MNVLAEISWKADQRISQTVWMIDKDTTMTPYGDSGGTIKWLDLTVLDSDYIMIIPERIVAPCHGHRPAVVRGED